MHCSLPHKFPCRNCDLRFTNKTKLDSHMQDSHDNTVSVNANECPTCGSRFSDIHKLRDHKKEPHNFNCKDKKCKKKFVTEVNLEKHLQRKHKEFAQATFKDGQILFRCKLCSKSFDANLALQSHQYIKHKYKCHLCEHTYVEKDDLTIHLVKSHRVDKIPQAGFRCKLCKLETKKMIEIRKHSSLSHKYLCSFCKMKYTNKNQLDVHMEENHMDQVMMAMVGGDPVDDNEAPEKQPYLARLGVNVLLWAGSKQVVKHLHRVMEGKTSSSRHKMFMNKQEREECCRSEDSKLYKMSGSRFLCLPTPTDQALIEVSTETYRAGQPILHGITQDRITFEYVTCVLIPEMWILYLRKLKGLSSEESEKVFVVKGNPDTTLAAWKELEDIIAKWKVSEERTEPKQTESPSKDQKRKEEDKEKRKSADPRQSKSVDPRLSKSVDPRLKSADPRLSKAEKQKSPEPSKPFPEPENNEVGLKRAEDVSPRAGDQELTVQADLNLVNNVKNCKESNSEEVELRTTEVDDSKTNAEVDELDTIAQFLEASS
eukprot:GFUD01107272.1.p1 GENE.GFUD01107272.1~~GFUD01107272.1.p1  ORF type:complete len:606 (-),score=136.33 GFUD01107272.1:8-1633(-)